MQREVLIIESHPSLSVLLEVVAREHIAHSKVQTVSRVTDAAELSLQADLIIINPALLPVEVTSDASRFANYLSKQFGDATIMCCGSSSDYDFPKQVYVLDTNRSGLHFIHILRAAFKRLNETLHQNVGKTRKAKQDYFNPDISVNPIEVLSERQLDILAMSSEGLQPIDIATEFGISVNTVRGHIQEIFSRLGVKNIAHAVAIYVKARMQTRLSNLSEN